ncbi:MAG: hypothetical protein M0R06_02870 [Sphaerochaeta sp.]|jgi:ABC-type multidrug transport system permease subunit|nr:hypothetical protein [Sphaerochaeta sp.]
MKKMVVGLYMLSSLFVFGSTVEYAEPGRFFEWFFLCLFGSCFLTVGLSLLACGIIEWLNDN